MKARVVVGVAVVAAVVAGLAMVLSGGSAIEQAAPHTGLAGTTSADRVKPLGTVNVAQLAAANTGSTAPATHRTDFPEIERPEILARLEARLGQGHESADADRQGGVDGVTSHAPLLGHEAGKAVNVDAIEASVADINPPASAVVGAGADTSGFPGVGILEMENAGTDAYAGTNGGLEPPDQAVCVGNGFVLEGVNTAWKVWGTDGTPKTAAVPITQFFRVPPAGQAGPSSFVSDPRCIFDPQSQRFFALTLEADEASGITQIPFLRAHTYFAVSKTSDPTGDWDVFNIDVTDDGQNGTPAHATCPCIDDQPLMGIDQNGLYITANEFSDSEIFPVPVPNQVNQVFNNLPDYRLGQSQVYALSKTDLLAGKAPKMQSFDTADVPLPAEDQGTPGAVWSELQPASSPPGDASTSVQGGVEYFMSQLDFTYTGDNRIAVWAVTNTSSLGAKPDVHLQHKVITTGNNGADHYAAPVFGVDQKDGPHPLGDSCGCPEEQLNANDDRMNQVMLTNNTLWGALNTALPASDAHSTGAAADPRAGVMYFQVQPTIDGSGNVDATLVRDGYIQVANNSVIFPSIAASPAGPVAAFFTLTGVDYYPSAAFARLDGVSAGQAPAVTVAAAGALPEDGFSGYPTTAQAGVPVDTDSGPGVARWGDYSAAGVDEHGCLWGAAEYIPDGARDPAAGNWGTYVMRVQPSTCAEGGLSTGATAPNSNPCGPLFTDPAGDDVQDSDLVPIPGTEGQNPQMDIVNGALAVSPDGSTVTTTLTIANLSSSLPSGGEANEYYFYWTYKGTVYFTNVEVDSTGAATYSDGIDSGGRNYRANGAADTGALTPGPNGTVVVHVPAQYVGSPKPGDVLAGGNAETRELEGALVLQFDAAGPTYDYVVGEACSTSA